LNEAGNPFKLREKLSAELQAYDVASVTSALLTAENYVSARPLVLRGLVWCHKVTSLLSWLSAHGYRVTVVPAGTGIANLAFLRANL